MSANCKKRPRDNSLEEGDGDALPDTKKRPFTKGDAKRSGGEPKKMRNTKLLINIDVTWGNNQSGTNHRQYKVGRLDPLESTFVLFCQEHQLVRSETIFTCGSSEVAGTESMNSAHIYNKHWLYAHSHTTQMNKWLGTTEDIYIK
ncbi:MAG: hypothetical protein WC763_06695 [Candidatus Paceibacterota bacterium]|jgi:hypothetical protein